MFCVCVCVCVFKLVLGIALGIEGLRQENIFKEHHMFAESDERLKKVMSRLGVFYANY